MLMVAAMFGLGGALLMLVPSSSPRTATSQENSQIALRDLQQRSRALHRRRLAELDRVQLTGVGEFHDHLKWIDEAAGQMEGLDGATLQIGSALLREMHRDVAVYETAADRLFGVGGIDPATINTANDLEQRLVLVRTVREASDRIAAHAESLPTRLSEALAKAGFEPSAVDTAVAGVHRGGNLDLILQIHQHERAICNSMLTILELLEREWGRWAVDAQGLVEFDRPDAAIAFAQLQRIASDRALEQEDAQRLLLMRKPVNGG